MCGSPVRMVPTVPDTSISNKRTSVLWDVLHLVVDSGFVPQACNLVSAA